MHSIQRIILYHRTNFAQKEKVPESHVLAGTGLIRTLAAMLLNSCRPRSMCEITQLLHPQGRNKAMVKSFGSFTKLLTSLIAEWYSVWREVTQVQQGFTLLVLGWVTAR